MLNPQLYEVIPSDFWQGVFFAARVMRFSKRKQSNRTQAQRYIQKNHPKVVLY